MSYLHCQHCGRGHDPEKVCGCPESLGEEAARAALLGSIIIPESRTKEAAWTLPDPALTLAIAKQKWLADTGSVEIPCMSPECQTEFDVNLYPTDTLNLYLGSCPTCYTGYKLEIIPHKEKP